MKCSWSHCEASSESPGPDGWKLVARHRSSGVEVVVCPEHFEALKDSDLQYLLKLALGSPVPVLSDALDSQEPTSRFPLKR